MTPPTKIENSMEVWVWPHGCPGRAVQATVDLISTNGNSLALSLRDKPEGVSLAGSGFFVNRQTGGLEMFLIREAARMWSDIASGRCFEIAAEKP